MKVLLKKLEARLRQLSPPIITVIALGWVLALGVADYCTPGPISLTVFYLFAVILAGWGAGKWHAWFIAGTASIMTLTVYWALEHGMTQSVYVAVWNNSARFLVLGLAGTLAAEMTRLTRNLEQQVQERTAQWKTEAEQHKATAARLSETVERFEQVINNITQVFWLTDLSKGEMVYISPGYERVWGRKCEELYREPMSWLAAVHPADRDTVSRRAHTDQAGGGYDVEYRIVRPDGAVRWIRDRAFPVRNAQGEVYRIAGLAEDITERKKTRETLQMQGTILENMAEGVVVTDEQGVIVQMNPAAEGIWGYSPQEVLGQPASVFSALPEPEATAVLRDVLAGLQATGTWRGVFKNRRKDGAIIHCEAVINRVEIQGRVLLVAVEQDVTERLRAQDQLQLQAQVLESMAEAVVVIDEKGTIVLTNSAQDALLGYERGELLGQPIAVASPRSPGEFRRRLETGLGQVKAHGFAAGEFVARRKDGTLIEVETRSSGIRIGARLFVVIVGQDITRRKQAEQALRQSEATLRVFLDALPAPAFLLDREGTILVANQALAQRLRIPVGELKGKHALGLIPAKLAETRKAVFDQVVRSRQPVRFEDEREGRHFINFESPVLDAAGNVSCVAVFALDITERKQAERTLARKEELYRTLFELSPDGILLEDLNGNLLDANQALCQWSGYSREELLRQNVRCFVPLEGQSKVEAHLAALRNGQTLEHEEWNIRKNGERCLIRLNEKPLALPDGSQGILVVTRDITQSKRGELIREVFLSLGAKLGGVRTPVEAGRAIYASADQLWKWDSAALASYSQESDWMEPVLFYDVMDGQRREVPDIPHASAPTARLRRIMEQGAELILRREDDMQDTESVRFGDVSRPSASIMSVPMRREGKPVGVLSIQSYTPNAYTQEDLLTLQALADHCGGALERIRAAQTLRQREELNRTILATAMDGFYALDFAANPAGAIIEVNEAYCRLTGYRPEELLQMRAADLEATETPEDIAQHAGRILAVGADRFETRLRRKDGQDLHVESSVSRLAGSRQRVFGFVRDITERKRSELLKEVFLSLGAKLSAATSPVEAARAFFANADLLWKWDAGTLDLYSPEQDWMQPVLFYDLMDGQRREVAPAYPAGAPPARLSRIMREGPELILRQPAHLESTEFVRFGDASRLSASLMYVALRREGQPIGVLSIQSYTPNAYTQEDLQTLQALADHYAGAMERIRAEAALREAHDKLELRVQERTTELQAVNEALRESETKYRRLHESMTDAFASVDMSGRITESNPAFQALLGYTADELRKLTYEDLTPEKWHASEARVLANQVLAQGYSGVYEKEYRRKDGTVFPVELRTFLLRDAGGEPLGMWAIVRDITERKRAEAALRLRENEVRTLVENSHDFIVRLDRAARQIYANAATARLYGLPPQDFLGKNLREMGFPEEVWRPAEETCNQVLTTRREAMLEQAHPFGGAMRYFEARHVPEFAPDGSVASVLVFTREITERKRAEAALREAHDKLEDRVRERTAELQAANTALRESEERYRSLVNNLNVGVYRNTPGPHGRFLQANPALARIHGYDSVEEFQRVRVADLYQEPRDRQEFVAELLRRGTLNGYELQLKKKDGTPIYASINATVHRGPDGEADWIDGMIEDITERKQAAEALKQAKRLQEAILDNIPDPVWLKDAQGRFLAGNQALAKFYRRTLQSIIGGTVFDSNPEHAERMTREDKAVMRERRPILTEASFLDAQGRARWLESVKSPIFNERDEVTGTVGIARDITERKQTASLLQAQRDLGVNLSLTGDLDSALKCLLDSAMQLGGLDTGGVYLLNEAEGGMDLAAQRGAAPAFFKAAWHWAADSPQMRLVRRGQPVFTTYRNLPVPKDRPRQSEGLRAAAIIPLCHDQKAIGAVALASHLMDEIPRQNRLAIEGIAAQAAGAIARIRAEAQRHRLERQILEITDREQARIGHEIHDGLCQHLVSLAFDANTLQTTLVAVRRPEAGTARRIARYLDEAITEARQLSRGLFPVRLEKHGLPPALEELAKATASRFHLRCRFVGDDLWPGVDSTRATHLYRIAQEAVTNAVKHSRARSVSIRLRAREGKLELMVADNGTGLSAASRKKSSGLGLHIMDYRARTIGGTLRLGPGRRGGTMVCCCVPNPPVKQSAP